MTLRRLLSIIVAIGLLAIAWSAGIATRVAGADVTFDQPVARAVVSQPVQFSETFSAPTAPELVELLVATPGEEGTYVQAAVVAATGDVRYRASVTSDGHETPNTTLLYRFRVRLPDGTAALGPQATATVVDDRFTWHTVSGQIVRLHWYSGSQSFATRALQIGEAAIERASALFGVAHLDPVDFFVYADSDAFLQALGPATRENTGGEYIPSTRTMFADIAPDQIDSGWVQSVIPHELTHLVFDAATRNPYHSPPLWLDEGLAVYLSDGPEPSHGDLLAGIDAGTLIPLTGLTGEFPRASEADLLAYAEAVDAVNYLVQQRGRGAILQLVQAYARGATDDEAFEAAAGEGMAAFGDAWLHALGVSVPQPYGPQAAPPGPTPAGWSSVPESQASGVGAALAGTIATMPGTSANPIPGSPGKAPGSPAPIPAGLFAGAAVAGASFAALRARAGTRRLVVTVVRGEQAGVASGSGLRAGSGADPGIDLARDSRVDRPSDRR